MLAYIDTNQTLHIIDEKENSQKAKKLLKKETCFNILSVKSDYNIPINDIENKIMSLLKRQNDHTVRFVPEDNSYDEETISESLVEESMCIDTYIKDGEILESYIKRVFLDKDERIQVTVCTNNCGVNYEDERTVSFGTYYQNNDQKAILDFCKRYQSKQNRT